MPVADGCRGRPSCLFVGQRGAGRPTGGRHLRVEVHAPGYSQRLNRQAQSGAGDVAWCLRLQLLCRVCTGARFVTHSVCTAQPHTNIYHPVLIKPSAETACSCETRAPKARWCDLANYVAVARAAASSQLCLVIECKDNLQVLLAVLRLHAQRRAANTLSEDLGCALTAHHDIPLGATPAVGAHGVKGDVSAPVEH